MFFKKSLKEISLIAHDTLTQTTVRCTGSQVVTPSSLLRKYKESDT